MAKVELVRTYPDGVRLVELAELSEKRSYTVGSATPPNALQPVLQPGWYALVHNGQSDTLRSPKTA
jgi:hypothetical protein